MNPASRLAARPAFHEDDLPGILAEIEGVLRSGRLILGPHTAALEREFAARIGTRCAVAVSSCSAALEIALRAVPVEHRAVIVPTNTFVATALSVERAGGFPIFCRTDERDGCLDVADVLALVGRSGAAAVVVVHLAGFIPHDLQTLMVQCRTRGVAVVEDCAHAHGARWGERHAGAIGDAGCFSFYPTKILTCGVGGMLTTDREDVADLARSLRHHGAGQSLESIVHPGSDFLLDEVRAVLARAQLRRLDEALAHRREVARRYAEALTPDVGTPLRAAPRTLPAFYKYPVLLLEGVDRDAVRARLAEQGIETGALYDPPCHRMPVFMRLGFSLPRSEAFSARMLCLPMHASVDPDDCAEIVGALRSAIEGRKAA